MSTPHRATPELWAAAEKFGQNNMDMVNCILELRARVEALEAQRPTAMDELRAASAEARPAVGRLVERVAQTVFFASSEMDAHDAARAAIREVAAWLRTGRLLHAAELLEQEVGR